MNRSVSTPKFGQEIQQNDSQPSSIQQPNVSNIVCRSILLKSSPTVMRMSPPATLRNWKFHKPLLAVGTVSGNILIYNLTLGKIYRELGVHQYTVKGIEWIGLNAFLSYAESGSPQGNEINWELNVTELNTGQIVTLKSGKGNESSAIQSVKASHLRQYFIIVYRNNPFEIWDLDSLSLVRRVPKKFSGIVAAEWNPLYSKKVENNDTADTKQPLRENFVVTNKMGELFHFSIAGNVVKEISNIPPESTITRAVTATAWKSDHVVLGRSDGNISVWDLGQKESRTFSTMRGSIKKIRFAPGRGNMKILILFEDGVDIWDVKRLRLVSTIIITRDQQIAVDDVDWAASDRPVVLTSVGTVVVTDLEFRQFYRSSQETNSTRTSDSSKQQQTQQGDSCYLQ